MSKKDLYDHLRCVSQMEATPKLERYEKIMETHELNVVVDFKEHGFVINNEVILEALLNYFVSLEKYKKAARTRDCIEKLNSVS